jgi:ATP-dependent helicase HepA
MITQLQEEVDRLKNLREINDHVRPVEIELAQQQLKELKEVINKARIRLDAVRLIWKGDPEAIKG